MGTKSSKENQWGKINKAKSVQKKKKTNLAKFWQVQRKKIQGSNK